MKKLNLNIQMFASTNKTANYDLPQFVGTDKPTWLGDFNEAMADIDAGMHENATDISTMATDVANAVAVSSQASQDVSSLTSTVNTLSNNVTTIGTTANNAQQTATSALNTANTANGKADTNAGAISSIQSNISGIEDNISTITEYSTTEKVVGTWIDGKPIYRKVVYYGNLPNATAKSVAHNISNLKQVITIDGVCFDGNDGYYTLPLVYRGSDSSYNVQTSVNSTDIRMASSQDRSNFTAYVIIEYTKTTD